MLKDFYKIVEFPERMFEIHDWCFRWAQSVDNAHSAELFFQDMRDLYSRYPEEVDFFIPRYKHIPEWERSKEVKLILKGILG